MNVLKHLCWLVILSTFLSACRSANRYDYGFAEGGIGGNGWPIWVENLVINNAWGVPVGSLSGQTERDNRPPLGKTASLGLIPLPHTIQTRWFSYRNQTFYEVTIELSEAKQTQIKQWFQQYPTKKYTHKLITGYAGQGEIQFWWNASCIHAGCPEDHLERHYFELTSRTKATVVEGNASIHNAGTRQEVEMGFLPPEVLDLLPPEEDEENQ